MYDHLVNIHKTFLKCLQYPKLRYHLYFTPKSRKGSILTGFVSIHQYHARVLPSDIHVCCQRWLHGTTVLMQRWMHAPVHVVLPVLCTCTPCACNFIFQQSIRIFTAMPQFWCASKLYSVDERWTKSPKTCNTHPVFLASQMFILIFFFSWVRGLEQ